MKFFKLKSIQLTNIILLKGGSLKFLGFSGGDLLDERFPMDKRKLVAKNKYDSVHEELLEVGTRLLSSEMLTEISLNTISDYTNVSKTTIYEHFSSSFNAFLSEVIIHVGKKIQNIYTENLSQDPSSNTLLIFRTWYEFNFTNIMLMRNIYASYILLVDTEHFPITPVLIDIENQLKDLEFSMKNMKEIVRIFYVSVDEIFGNPDVKKIDHVMKDIEKYLIDFTNS